MLMALKSVERVSRSTPPPLSVLWPIDLLGTQRRTKKVVTSNTVEEDKKLKATVKKFGMWTCHHFFINSEFIGVQALNDIDEVNMFKDDNTIVHFKKPQSKY